MLGSLIFGPTMVRIRGNYDDVNRLCTEIADKYGWAIVNVNLRPYYTEGAKTYGFEIAEQLGWQLPQHTIVPTAGGTILPEDLQGVPGVHRARPGRRHRAEDLFRAGGRLQSGRDGDPQGHRHHRAAEAQHDRQEHRDRQPRRRLLRRTRSSTNPAAGARAPPTARSSTRSSCSPRPKASGPSPPAARRWPPRSS